MPKLSKSSKIYIRNWSTDEIRWKYADEQPKGEWPNYGYRVLKTGKKNAKKR